MMFDMDEDAKWVADRIEAEHRKHSRKLDWALIAAMKILSEINVRLEQEKIMNSSDKEKERHND